MSTPTARKPWPADKLPLRVRGIVCPMCGGALLIRDVEACELADNGDWIASEVSLDCENEPDMDSDEWEGWHRWHYSEPYTDWLPVDRIILRFLRANYSNPTARGLCRPLSAKPLKTQQPAKSDADTGRHRPYCTGENTGEFYES